MPPPDLTALFNTILTFLQRRPLTLPEIDYLIKATATQQGYRLPTEAEVQQIIRTLIHAANINTTLSIKGDY